jgi:hypothetical protein
MTNKRPLTVTILALLVLSFTVFNTVRFGAAIAQWNTLISLGVIPNPVYIALTGLFWAICGLGLFISLWTGRPLARKAGMGLIPLYAVYYWLDRLVFQGSVARENGIFAIIFTFLVVFYTYIALSLPASQIFMRGKK